MNMLPIRTLFASCLAIALACSWTSAIVAQVETAPAAEATSLLTVDLVQSRLRAVQEAKDLDETARTKIADTYKQAVADLEAAKNWETQAADFVKRIAGVPERLVQVKNELGAMPTQSTPQIPPDASLVQLEQLLQQREAELTEAKKALAELEDEPKRRANRRLEIPKLLAAARDRLADVDKEAAIPPAEQENPQFVAARRDRLATRRQAAQAEIAAIEKELALYDACAELLPMRRDLQQRRTRLVEQDVKFWQDAVARRRNREVAQQNRSAELALERVAQALRPLAQQNLALAEQRKEIDQQIKQLRTELDTSKALSESIQSKHKGILEKEQKIGLTGALGMLLRKHHSALPDVKMLTRQSGERQQQIGDVQVKLLDLQQQRSSLGDLDKQVDEVVAETAFAEVGAGELKEEARELLVARRDYLDGLLTDYNKYFEGLVDLDSSQQELIGATRQYNDYIDERVLWIRSADTIALSDVGEATEAALWLFQPTHWLDLGNGLLADVTHRPWPTVLVVLVFTPLLVYRMQLRKIVREAGQHAAGGDGQSFKLTLRALICTALVAIVWPGLLAYVGWRLAALPESIELAGALSAGLLTAAGIYLPLEMWRQVSRPMGLARSHFGWSEYAIKSVRRNLRWLIPVVVPMTAVVVSLHAMDNPARENSLGRFAFLILLLAAGFFLLRVLNPKHGALRQIILAHRGGWTDQLSSIWYPLTVCLPLALAGAAASGYYYTAGQLALRLQSTAFLILSVLLISALVMRWVYVNQRRIAAQQARVRLQEAKAAAALAQTSAHASDYGLASEIAGTKRPENPEMLDLVKIDQQTRRLIRSFALLCSIVGVWLIWNDVIPAFNFLERVELWDTVVEVTQPVEATDGSATAETIRSYVSITLLDLGLSLLVLAMTFVAIKNIPGLLEVTVLQRLPLDASLRFAITTVTRYALIIVGLAWALSNIGCGWSKIQWLVAAVSVGLGFGLQEIFANFISGLILLFERPLRAGDIVTVGDVSGKVLQIRTRATVIQDWDRKELVMPNKEFITGRLLNWTLSDPVNRIVVQVGVAYTSDTTQAREIILAAAQQHPHVLDDPAPSVTFDAFGDSALNFTLRAFLPNLDNRLAVIHDLHATIHTWLGEAGIEISVPQLDMHIRSIEVPLPLVRDKAVPAKQPESRKSA
jgi:potassium efflux system protein